MRIVPGLTVPLLAVACLSCGVRVPILHAPKTLGGYEICTGFIDGLALVKHSKSWQHGYIDRAGTIVIPASFPDAQPFAEGLAAVQVERWGKYGYIDKQGRTVIEPAFDAAFPFSEGLAVVRLAGKYGFIDRTGKLVIQPAFDRAHSFSGGRARIVERGLAGFIDAGGHIVVAPSYYRAGDYRDGLAYACRENRCGFLDAAGATAIPFDYEDAGSFSSGAAPVRSGGKWGYLDAHGAWLVKPAYDVAHEFRDGAALVGLHMASQPDRGYGGYSGWSLVYGYVKPDGKYLIEPSLHSAESFSEGLARIRVPSGGLCSDCYDTAYLRRDGSLVGRFASGGDFEGGAAIVRDGVSGSTGFLIDANGRATIGFDGTVIEDPLRRAAAPGTLRYGYIDKTGRVRLPHHYFEAQPFSEGLALVRGHDARNKPYSAYVDPGGAVRVQPPAGASRLESFAGGFALVWFSRPGGGHRFSYIDHGGALRIEAAFAEARPFSEGLAAVRVSSHAEVRNDWGYIDSSGQLAIQPAFSFAGPFLQGVASVAFVKGTYIHSGLIDKSGKVLAELFYQPEPPEAQPPPRSVSRDFIPARDRQGFGYVNRQGAFVLRDRRLLGGGAFAEGLAPALLAGAENLAPWGYIDTTGRIAIEARFRQAGLFSRGVALVQESSGLYGYIRRDGTWAVPPRFFEEAGPFSEGLALVRLNGFYGYVNAGGEFAVPPQYPRALPFSEGFAVTAVETK
jgi:hypothetical protein